jgi:hypothetical protein
VPQLTELPSETLFLNKKQDDGYVQIVHNCIFKLVKVIATTEPSIGKTDATVGMLSSALVRKDKETKASVL